MCADTASLQVLPSMILCPETSPTALFEVGWLRVAGKFLRQGGSKVFLRGISYGPFRPNSRGEPWPEVERLSLDLDHIASLGFDTVRLYHPPDEELLGNALRLGLKLIVGIAWTDHLDFLRDRSQCRRIIEAVEADRRAVYFPPIVRLLQLVHNVSPRAGDALLRRLRGGTAAPRRD